MRKRPFRDREIGIVDIDDASSGEHVIEFHDPAIGATGAHLAVVIPEDGGWEDALVSVSPRVNEISAAFVTWSLETARAIAFPSTTT
ncbi:hypothetical protein [Streptomyces profundus]|uniref:hypothetical protein n=1 Tax=Streptomyces profundus TaxID=2867410 RepID=UPI001D162314|nr:hypothetical protein [Streptomyces sp. MA3_2.13]UED86110.1 hypothetical protein K4G22_19545 [Streptomyces sp. MA3_2.13]